ncbi:MAG: thioredoxin [Acidimicrobiales bacterium]
MTEGAREDAIVGDGVVAFVKRDCPTCQVVMPVLAELEDSGRLAAVYVQDDPGFFAGLGTCRDDTTLERSYRSEVDTVPTLIERSDGVESRRLVGWSREEWSDFFAAPELAAHLDLPPYRPGCGSLNVDPDRAASLEARFGDGLASRRVELAGAEDPVEAFYDRGWTDGYPVVPPTPERVIRMLEGTTRAAHEVVAVVPPNLAECTVEKVAVNAVMAGCRPDYLPVVLTALEAVCTDEFNMHGLLASTMANGPIIVVNGPIRSAIGLGSGMSALGNDSRANATIGRAVQLVVRNVGGGAPGGVDRAALGQPAKTGLCFAENEEDSPWSSHATEHGIASDRSAVTVFAGEAPHQIVDQISRSPESLARSFALALRSMVHPKLAMVFDAILVVSPEHGARFRDAGWSRARLREELAGMLLMDADELIRGAQGIEEGLPAGFAGAQIPKMRDGGLLIVHAGGPAGLFSAVIPGWINGDMGSQWQIKTVDA